ncbi:putative breast cancer type 2 susceptibility protein-like isoform X2, partial [Penaeus vannamei]
MGVDLYTWYHQVKKKDLGETKENWLQHLQEQALSKKRTKKEQKSYDGSPGMPAGDFFESGLREGASGIASTKNSKCSTPRTPEKLIKSPFSALLDSSFITPTLVLSHSKDDGSPETSCVSPPFNPNALGLDLFSPVISKANTSVKVAASLGANLDDSLSSWTSALATPLTTDARAQTPTTLERLTLHPKQGLRQKVMVRSLFSPRTPGTSTRTDESPNLGIIKCYSPIPTFNNRAVLKQQKQMPDNSSLPLLSDTQSFRVCDKGNSSEEGKQLQLNVNQLEGSGLSLNNINPDIDGGPEQTAKGPGQILHHGTDISLPSSPEESLGCHKLGSSLKPDDGTQFYSKAVLKKLSVHKNKRLSGRFLYPRKAEAGYEKLNMKYQECLDDAQTTVIDADMADITTENVSQESKSEKTPKDIHDIANRQQNFVSLATLEKDDRLGLEKTLNSNETKYRAQLEMGRQEEPMKQASEKTKIFVGKFSGETDRNAISPTREEGRATHSMNVNIMSKDGRSEATWTEPEDLQTAIGLQVVPQKDLKSKQEVIEHAGARGTKVRISDTALLRARKLWEEDEAISELGDLPDPKFANTLQSMELTEVSKKTKEREKSSHSNKGAIAPSPHNFLGFCTGQGKPVEISKESLTRSRNIFEDIDISKDEKTNGAKVRLLQPEYKSKDFSDGREEDLEVIGGHVVGNTSSVLNMEEKSAGEGTAHNFNHCEHPQQFAGFSTARGTKVRISDAALLRARKLWEEDEAISELGDLPDPKFANTLQSMELTEVSKSQTKEREKSSHSNKGAIAPSPHNFLGFCTGQGKPVEISKESLTRSRNIFEDIDISKDEKTNGARVRLLQPEYKSKDFSDGREEDLEVIGVHVVGNTSSVLNMEEKSADRQIARPSNKRLSLRNSRTTNGIPKKSNSKLGKRGHSQSDQIFPEMHQSPAAESESQPTFLAPSPHPLPPDSQTKAQDSLQTQKKITALPDTQEICAITEAFLEDDLREGKDSLESFNRKRSREGLGSDEPSGKKFKDGVPQMSCNQMEDTEAYAADEVVESGREMARLKQGKVARYKEKRHVTPIQGVLHRFRSDKKHSRIKMQSLGSLKMDLSELRKLEQGMFWPPSHHPGLRGPPNPLRIGLCGKLENVVARLKYRYDREIDRAERPILRKIMEHDDVPQKTMILCVANVKKTPETTHGDGVADTRPRSPYLASETILELTDGWYSIDALTDTALSRFVLEEKVKIGTKLLVHGAEMAKHSPPCHPLQASTSVCLRLHANMTRRAKWWSRLGLVPQCGPLPTMIRGIQGDGGLVGRLTVLLARVYPPLYFEKTGGKSVFRSERAHDRLLRENLQEKERNVHQILAEVEREFDSQAVSQKQSRKTSSSALRGEEIRNLTSGKDIAQVMEEALDPSSLEGLLSTHQIELARSWRLREAEERKRLINLEVQRRLAKKQRLYEAVYRLK